MRRAKLAIGLALCLLVAGLAGCAKSGDEIRMGTGGIGGTYYAYGSALGQIMEQGGQGTWNVKTTAGSAANLRLISEGILDMGIVQSDVLEEAANGIGRFEGKKIGGFSAVAGLYTEACQIVTSADSGIMTVEDLMGKRVSLGEEESGVLLNAEAILLANGLTTEVLVPSYLSFADSAAAMQKGEIDAFFCTAGAPTAAVSQLAENMDIRVLSLDQRTIRQMKNLFGGYVDCEIPAGTYAGQTEKVNTIGVKAVLVSSVETDQNKVYGITGQLFANADKLQYATNVNTPVELTFATEGIPGGFHPGAAKYYSEQGITVTAGGSEGSGSIFGGQD